jgi:hypothetical protein
MLINILYEFGCWLLLHHRLLSDQKLESVDRKKFPVQPYQYTKYLRTQIMQIRFFKVIQVKVWQATVKLNCYIFIKLSQFPVGILYNFGDTGGTNVANFYQ